jgi:hypothetical protein
MLDWQHSDFARHEFISRFEARRQRLLGSLIDHALDTWRAAR